MLSWALGFFILAIIAAFFGFGGIATSAAGIAQVLFVVFLVVFELASFAFRRAAHLLLRCPDCGYDRHRLVADVPCPGCGRVA